jgi:hypothetical protein
VGRWVSGWVISLRETEVCNRLIESQKGGTREYVLWNDQSPLPIILSNVPGKAHYNKLGNAPNIKNFASRMAECS